MSFPRHERYKKTRVEWLGDIPEHWHLSKLGFESWVRARLGWKGLKAEEYVEEGFVFLSTPNIKRRDIDFEGVNFISQERYDESPEIKLSQGDILLVKDGSTLGITNVVRTLPEPTTVNSSIAVITPSQKLDSIFLYYLLLGAGMQQLIQQKKGGMGVPHLFQSDIVKFPISFPSNNEQRAIANFLDHETAKIDALITEQERLIDLLQEKRQAVISHAVTKGLNPNAPMKDSGVEWLGEVPEHWLITPLKYLVTMKSGGTPSKSNLDFWDGGNIPWASSKDLKTDKLEDTQDHITQQAIIEGAVQIQIKESVFICVRGMILAHTFPVVEPKQEMAINQDLKCLIPKKELNHEYLAILLRGLSKEILGRVDEAAHGTKVLRIPDFSSLLVPVPPHEEQERIHKDIGVSNRQFERLQAHCTNSIQLLQERRSALISAAVTGQIDVRGLDPEEESA